MKYTLMPYPASQRSGASLLSATDCLSQKQRRWPEDMAWHPEGNSIFSVYNADDGDSQISVLNLNRTKGVRALLEIDYWRLINNCHFILILVYMF
ncbi:hypothetical protein CK203_068737 [Vitis vinifera]|uniref:Uncharacterized protein n=1 Tax=Vitis vinifera TaxID=29760 RepID=A0A438EXV7_VITVI|nr:hypothetical protein CK203_068737 [Vitis vinifera]